MKTQSNSQNNRLVAGVALVAIGLLMLAGQYMQGGNWGLLFLPALGLIFIAWGLMTRTPGLLIPGGILMGIGAGTIYTQQMVTGLEGTVQGGIIVLCMGLGFALIFPLALVSNGVRMWWTLIVGGIMALIGLALLAGGPALTILEWVGNLWPLALVAVGGWIIYKAMKQNQAR